ncbi:MAG: Inositol-1-phosphate synthase, partial [uncultured Sphingomonadaceae bacterium]
ERDQARNKFGHRRRRQLRVLARAGTRALRERRGERADRADALGPGRIPAPGHPGRGGVGRGPAQGRARRGASDLRQAELHDGVLRPCAAVGRGRADGAGARRGGRTYGGLFRRPHVPARGPWRAGPGRGRRAPARNPRRRAGQLPSRGEPGGNRVLRRMRARGRGGVRQQHPRVHRVGRGVGEAVRRCPRADHRRRHQGAAGGDDRPPRADGPVRQARGQARPDVSAQHRGQHGFRQHGEPGAIGVQEDQQDGGRAVGGASPAGAGRHPHRAVGLCRVAERQQGLLPPHGGADVRRGADEPGAQAVGGGQPQQRGRRDRHDPLRQARQGPRHRRPDPPRRRLFLQASARADDRRCGLRG